jgi:hypothetical protein
VGGLGLMTVATYAVDILATKILPAKVVYNKFKYEETNEINRTPPLSFFSVSIDSHSVYFMASTYSLLR